MSIYIKTTMKKIPKSCSRCHFHSWLGHRVRPGDFNDGVCEGKKPYKSLGQVHISSERPAWCPLQEIKEKKEFDIVLSELNFIDPYTGKKISTLEDLKNYKIACDIRSALRKKVAE